MLNSLLKLFCPFISKVLWTSSYSNCFYYVTILFYVHSLLLGQRQFDFAALSVLVSLAPVHSPEWDSTCFWKTSHYCFCPCHISSVVSTAILSIFLILSTVLTLVLSNSAKTRMIDLMDCFLSGPSPISFSQFFCRLSLISSTTLNRPSSASASASSRLNSSSSWLIFSKIYGVDPCQIYLRTPLFGFLSGFYFFLLQAISLLASMIVFFAGYLYHTIVQT